ncbi:MAG: hypothetical protein CR955_00375 [Thiotrichales bacterium]|nr:MAG: hypothetical protein CR955_00375 [Thiotrichales bacterium]
MKKIHEFSKLDIIIIVNLSYLLFAAYLSFAYQRLGIGINNYYTEETKIELSQPMFFNNELIIMGIISFSAVLFTNYMLYKRLSKIT